MTNGHEKSQPSATNPIEAFSRESQNQPIALNARILLGKYDTSPAGKIDTDITPDNLADTAPAEGEKPSQKFAKAMAVGVAQASHAEYQSTDYSANITEWVQKTTKSLNEHSQANVIKQMKIGGVNFGSFTTAECAKMYDRYFGAPTTGNTVNIVKLGDKQFFIAPNIQLFIDDAYASFKGKLETDETKTAIRYLANMFGKDNVDLIMAGIRAKEIAESSEAIRKDFADKANDSQDSNNRRNVFNPDLEKKELDKLKKYDDAVATKYYPNVTKTSVTITPRPTNIPELGATPTANPTADAARTEQQEVIPADEVGKVFEAGKTYTLEGMFGRVPGNVPPNHEYTVVGDPQPVENVERFATNIKEPFFIDVTVSPKGLIDYKTNAKVIPYVWNDTGKIPRFISAEGCTDGDSGFFAVCALAGQDQEHQGKVYKIASQAILNIHKNPNHLQQWLQTQTNADGPTVNIPQQDGTSIPTKINSIFLFIDNDKDKDRNLRPENERLFPDEKTVSKFMELWQRRIPELEQALAQNKLQPHHLRWIEFLSHSVDVDAMMKEIKAKATPEIIHVDIPTLDQIEIGPDAVQNKRAIDQFTARLRSGDFSPAKTITGENDLNLVVNDFGFTLEKPPETGWFGVESACRIMEEKYKMPLAIFCQGRHATLVVNGPTQNPTSKKWGLTIYNPQKAGFEEVTLPDEAIADPNCPWSVSSPTGSNISFRTNSLWVEQYKKIDPITGKRGSDLDFRTDAALQPIKDYLISTKTAPFQYDGKNCVPITCFVGTMLTALQPGNSDFVKTGLIEFEKDFKISIRSRDYFVTEANARKAAAAVAKRTTPPAPAPTLAEPPAPVAPSIAAAGTGVVAPQIELPELPDLNPPEILTNLPKVDTTIPEIELPEVEIPAPAVALDEPADAPTNAGISVPQIAAAPPTPPPPSPPVPAATPPPAPPQPSSAIPTIEADTGLSTPESEPVRQVYELFRKRIWAAFSDNQHPLNREMQSAVNTLFPPEIEGVPQSITPEQLTDEKINELLKSFVSFKESKLKNPQPISNGPLEVKIVSSSDKSEPIHIKYSWKGEDNSYASFSQSSIASYLIAPNSEYPFILDTSDVKNDCMYFNFRKPTSLPPITGYKIFCSNVQTTWVKSTSINIDQNNAIQDCREAAIIYFRFASKNTTPVKRITKAKTIATGKCNMGEVYEVKHIDGNVDDPNTKIIVDHLQPNSSISLGNNNQILLLKLPEDRTGLTQTDQAMVVYPREAMDLDGLKRKLIKDRAILNQIDEAIPSTFTQYLIRNNGKRKLLSVVPVYKYSQDGKQEKAYALVELTPTVTGTFEDFTPENTYLKLIQAWTETDQPTEVEVPDDDGTVWGTIKLKPQETTTQPPTRPAAAPTPQPAQQTTATATARTAAEKKAPPKEITKIENIKQAVDEAVTSGQVTERQITTDGLANLVAASWPTIEEKIKDKIKDSVKFFLKPLVGLMRLTLDDSNSLIVRITNNEEVNLDMGIVISDITRKIANLTLMMGAKLHTTSSRNNFYFMETRTTPSVINLGLLHLDIQEYFKENIRKYALSDLLTMGIQALQPDAEVEQVEIATNQKGDGFVVRLKARNKTND